MVAVKDIVGPYLATVPSGQPFLNVEVEAPSRLAPALTRGADLAISATAPIADANIVLFASAPSFAYVPLHHPWSSRDRVSLAELVEQDLLVPTADYPTRRILDGAVEQTGRKSRAVTEFRLPQVAQALAASGGGIAVVSDDARFGLHPLVVEDPAASLRIALYAAWARAHYADRAIRHVVDGLAAYCAKRYGTEAIPAVVDQSGSDSSGPT